MSRPLSEHTPTLCCCGTHGSSTEDEKAGEDGVEQDGKRQKFQWMLKDPSTALLVAISPLSRAPTVEGMFGDLLQDEPRRVRPRRFSHLEESASLQAFVEVRS